MTRPSSRERILDALSLIVVEHGVGAATLDAVCAKAGVSKGGLLYHFPSRDLLFAGLHERLIASIDAATADAPREPKALIDWYLRIPTLTDTESGLYAALIASARADASGDVASVPLAELFGRFFEPLRQLEGSSVDAALIAHVEMVADGMFLRAILRLPLPDDAARTAMVERLTRNVARRRPRLP